MKKKVTVLVLLMVLWAILFLVFVFITLLMAQKNNFEASLLSMLLFVACGMMFGHFKDKWVKLDVEQ